MTTDRNLGQTPPALEEGFKLEEHMPGANPAPEPEAAPQPEPTPEVYTLRKDNLYQELKKLSEEDERFGEVVGIYGGRKTATRYQRELDETKIELEELRRYRQEQEFLTMPSEELNQRFATDADFAKRYTDFLHSKGVDTNQVREITQIKNAVEELFNEHNLSPELEKEFRDKLAAGDYDSGAWTTGILKLNNDIIKKLGTSSAVPATPAPATPQISPKQDNASPDMSSTGIVGSRGSRWTRAQIQAMNPIEYMQAFPNEGDEAKAVAAGLIIDESTPA